INATYLYPPQTSQIGFLTGTVTDQDWGHPVSGAEVQIDGLYDITNSTGQYSISLQAGLYDITVNKDLYLSTTIQDVSVVAETTTTQDIVLERWFYNLELQVQGSGSLNPSAGFYMDVAGSIIEVQATADSGWTFAYWLFDLVNAGSENPYSFILDFDHVLKAVFIEEAQLGLFQGTVIDAESEAPIPEAQLNINFATFHTDPEGNFEIELEAGEYDVFIEANGYHSQEMHIQIQAGSTNNQNFLLEKIESTIAMVESSNSAGDQKDFFELGETVYVMGSGYSPSTTYSLYVVEDVATWNDGTTIPTRVPETAANISSNTEGAVSATVIWSDPQAAGKYDIVVDVNSNGVYDVGVDALDDSDIEVTAGMVIPEFSPLHFISLFITLSIFSVSVCKVNRRKCSPILGKNESPTIRECH
ncbi:hypothetical protein E2P61_00330, partial [Candidatus Bathyarchaeota archaeon]